MNCIVCDKVIDDKSISIFFKNADTDETTYIHEECHSCMNSNETKRLSKENKELLNQLTKEQMVEVYKKVFNMKEIHIHNDPSKLERKHLLSMLKMAIDYLIQLPLTNCTTEVQYIDMKSINDYLRKVIV